MNAPQDETVRFAPEQAFREAVARRFDEVKALLEAVIPGAEILHVGGTAIPAGTEAVISDSDGLVLHLKTGPA